MEAPAGIRPLNVILTTPLLDVIPVIPSQSKNLVYADNVCDYIPIISSISNAVDLCFKEVLRTSNLAETPPTDYTHYQWHLQEKSTLRCIILMLLPGIGNFIFFVYDCINRNYSNEEFVFNLVQQPGRSGELKNASLELRTNPRIILAAIRTEPEHFGPPTQAQIDRIRQLRPDRDGIIRPDPNILYETRESAILHASPILKYSIDFLRLACSTNGKVLLHANLDGKRDLIAVAHAVNHTPSVYRLVDMSLRQEDSKESVELADLALRFGTNIKIVPNIVKNNRQKALNAVRQNPNVLQDLPQFKDDNEFADVALEKNGEAYKYLSPRLKQDRYYAEKAVRKGCSIEHLPTAFRGNEYMVRLALENGNMINPGQIRFASAELRNNIHVMIFAAQNGAGATVVYQYASVQLHQNRVFAQRLVEINAFAYNGLPLNWRSDVDIAIKAYEGNPMTLRFIPDTVQRNPRFIARKQQLDSLPPAERYPAARQ